MDCVLAGAEEQLGRPLNEIARYRVERVEDTNRILERKALRNVRALVDKLERADTPNEWRLIVLIAGLVASLLVVMGISAYVNAVRESTARERLSCELEIWSAKSGELQRRLREANPNQSSREVQLQLKRERPFIMADAKVECARAGAK